MEGEGNSCQQPSRESAAASAGVTGEAQRRERSKKGGRAGALGVRGQTVVTLRQDASAASGVVHRQRTETNRAIGTIGFLWLRTNHPTSYSTLFR